MPAFSLPLLLEAFLLLTVLAGFVGLLLRRNLFLKLLAMDVMSTGVISFFVLLAARRGLFTPILEALPDRTADAAYADPIPQAVILTAIVIGFSTQALMLVAITQLSRREPSLEVGAMEETRSG